MNNRENSQLMTYNGLEQFLDENATVYTAYTAFKNEVDAFKTAKARIQQISLKTVTGEAGSVELKNMKRDEMAEMASALGSAAMVKFKKDDKPDLAQKLSWQQSDYNAVSDETAAQLAQSTYDVMNQNIALLDPDYVTAAELADFQAVITEYKNAQAKNTSAHQGSSTNTSSFKNAFKVAEECRKNIVLLGRKLRKTNPDFYNDLKNHASIKDTGIRHTSASGTVRNENNEPVSGAIVTLSNAGKQAIAEADGTFLADNVKNGKENIQCKAPGYEDYASQVTIQRSMDNHFDIVMKKKV